MWQDVVIAACQVVFIPSMLPTLRGRDKPAFVTSALNAALVAIIATMLGTLHLWFSMFTAVIMAVIWAALAVQKFRMDKSTD